MSSLPLMPALAVLFALVAGWGVNRLLRARAAEGRPVFDGAAISAAELPTAAPGRAWPAVNMALLAAGAGALALHPALDTPFALSQALLLLFLAYPLALVDLFTLTVEPGLVLGGLALRVAAVSAFAPERAADMAGGALGGAGLLYLIGFAYRELRGREGLGAGDPAVLALIGAFVGWRGLPAVVLIATAAGLLIGFPALLALRRPLTTPLPFVPFLCVGGLAVYLLQVSGISIFGMLPAW